MSKWVKLMAASLCLSTSAIAQEVTTDSLSESDEFDFSLTEGQIDEDAEAANTVTMVSSKKDPYLSNVGYAWSAMRFKYRTLDNAYVGNYFNGVKLNNIENGRFSFSGITGGLNDATRNKEGVGFFDDNDFAFAPLGGASNTDIRASHYAAGNKVGLAFTNRNYYVRGNYTYASGLLQNGWAFMGSVAYRYADRGNIEGTFYNSFSFMLGAEKRFGDNHALSFNIWGAPTERGQQGASTEEAYALANSHYYNPYWGYQNGKRRNSRVVTEFSPSALLTWDWKIDDNTKLTTTAALTWMNYASTALSYNNAYNPRPDYYKNLPSSVFNVYSEEYNNPDWLAENPGVLAAYNTLYDYWTASKANRQVQWDLLYAQNEANNATGKDALYYLEKRHNNQLAFNFASTINGKINAHDKYTAGITFNSTKGMHYKTMDDLLGAKFFHDEDNYSLNKYGSTSNEYFNDLDNLHYENDKLRGAAIKEGDKFGYNYNIYVSKVSGFAQNVWKKDGFTASLSGNIEGTFMEREGLMRNGRAANYSKGNSGVASFLGGGGKLLLQQQVATSTFYAGISFESLAPVSYNVFVAPRVNNNYANNLKNEYNNSIEVGYQWYFGNFSGKVTGYYTHISRATQQTAFYNDDASYLTYLTMTDLNKMYKGIEASFTYKFNNHFKAYILGTIAEAKYTKDPLAQLAYEGSDYETTKSINAWKNEVTGENRTHLKVLMQDVKIGSAPQACATIGLNYNINGWYLEAKANFYDRIYIDASPYRRLANATDAGVKGYASNISDPNINGGYTTAWDYARETKAQGAASYVYDAATGDILATFSPEQEKCDGGWMIDASIGKSINLKGGKRLSINLQLQNINNNTKMQTGGYEQNRSDRTYDYMFSRNNYYYYAMPFNAFLNASLKF